MKQFRTMRRRRQQLSREETERLLASCTSGVLAVTGDEGYPYAVPLSYVYSNGKIYFHSALQGHKIDSILRDNKVSFCVIDKDEVIAREFTTYFRSAIAFGKARILTRAEEKMRALRLLAARYADESVTEDMTKREIANGFDHLHIIELEIEHLSGKEAIELVRKRDGIEGYAMIRPTAPDDLDAVMEIYASARERMRDGGNRHQWTRGYPSRELIMRDIANGHSHVVEKEGEIAGVFTFIIGEEPTYSKIEGHWPDSKPYGTIHRIASAPGAHGIADRCLEFCKSKNVAIRIDTHADNSPMLGWIAKRGFTYCGIIRVNDGTPRKAFQLSI